MKKAAMILVLLALCTLSGPSLKAATAPAVHASAAPSAALLWSRHATPSFVNPCPDMCWDPDCSCVFHGYRVGGQCIYDQYCTDM
jgi:hypothetical protein